MLCTQFWDVFFQDLINQKMISRIILKKTLERHSQGSIFLSASTLKSITWTVCPAVMKSQIGLQNPRNIFNASIESQRAMAQWRCSSPTLLRFCYGGYDGIYDFLHSGAYVVMRMVLFMVMIVFISCSQSWYLLMTWNIFVALFVTTSGKSSSNQIIVFIVDVRVYLKFDLLEIVLHGVAGPGPFREHVHHSEDSLVSTWMKIVGRKSTMEREKVQQVQLVPS